MYMYTQIYVYIYTMGNFIDLTGKTFGRLLVVKKAENASDKKRIYWECVCECGNTKVIMGESLKYGWTKSCGCLQKETAKINGVKGIKFGDKSPQWKGYKDIPKNAFNNVMNGAKSRDIEFSITMEDIQNVFEKQNRRCAYTGVPLSFTKSRIKNLYPTASIDRIDSSKGYTPNNIQITHKDVNKLKQDFEESRFIELCEQVINYNRSNKEKS